MKKERDQEGSVPHDLQASILDRLAKLPPGGVFSPHDLMDIAENLGADLGYFVVRSVLRVMILDTLKAPVSERLVYDLGVNSSLFVTATNGGPPPAADIVRAYGEKAGYIVETDEDKGIYRTSGPALTFLLADREIRLEHDPVLASRPRVGSGNFLKDRGYANPGEIRSKHLLLNEIGLALEDGHHTFNEVAAMTGVRFPVTDARWSARMMEKDIVELRNILNRIRDWLRVNAAAFYCLDRRQPAARASCSEQNHRSPLDGDIFVLEYHFWLGTW